MAYSKATTQTPEYRKKHAEFQAALRKERREKGLCPRCGKNPPREAVGRLGGADCAECAAKNHAKYLQKDPATSTANRRKAAGLCVNCGGPRADSDTQCCPSCRKKQNKRGYRQREGTPQYEALLRDNFACQLCGRKGQLHIHHIDGNGTTSHSPNDSVDNLITLCGMCHYAITCLRQSPPDKRQLIYKLIVT